MHESILVHCCCGPCSTASIERLLQEGWKPVLYFSNDNIDSEEEFEKRYENLIIVAEKYNLRVIKKSYEHSSWREFVKGLEQEKEHGKRCVKCFRYNLLEASKMAESLGIKHFCTTLTVSRFKNSFVIFSQGEDLLGFEKIDFKKKDGFAISCKLANELGLYRQQYCGCEFRKIVKVKY